MELLLVVELSVGLVGRTKEKHVGLCKCALKVSTTSAQYPVKA